MLCHLATPIALGGPYGGLGGSAAERDRIEEEWKAGIVGIAELPHVRFKISGMLMPILGFGAEQRDRPMSVGEFTDRVGPLVEWAVGTIGIARCMFGSNFPMDKVSIDWATLVSGYDALLASRTEDERTMFYGRTAREFYRLEG